MLIATKLEIVPGVPVPNPGTIRGAGTIKAAPLLHLIVPDFNRLRSGGQGRLNPRKCWVSKSSPRPRILRIQVQSLETIAPTVRRGRFVGDEGEVVGCSWGGRGYRPRPSHSSPVTVSGTNAPVAESAAMRLRDYQERDVERLREAMRSSRRVLYVAPTGSGKTVLFAAIAHGAAVKGKRVLVLVHRIELVLQT